MKDFAWDDDWGPKPEIKEPDSCPPSDQAYSMVPGSGGYGWEMFWRGLIPMAGGFMQSSVKQPDTCIEENNSWRQLMAAKVSQWQNQAGDSTIALWVDLNTMLQNLVGIGAAVSDLLTQPLEQRILYLLAGMVALGMICVVILMGI